ncbi:GDP-mannose 4,6-dehydratase [Thiobacillus sp.]|uniref:GDP-mannose 4,6-dehydratase n=1 Tax=Thiobacillus sp. TaxID=924 RepID=UPI0025E9544C|nr:GDP-mannose 4,6-dehydratase [Thiobacillus sp.]
MSALVCGISGQDGAYLAQLLLDKGYEVVGTSRSTDEAHFTSLVALGIRDHVRIEPLSVIEPDAVLSLLKRLRPDEIYNLSGQSSVGLSFTQPIEALQSISVATLNLLEAMRVLQFSGRFFNACSSECFGNTDDAGADEMTPFRPRSPYAIAKAAAYWQVADYRAAYGLYACSGILFNHESPLRPPNFVTRKIINGAYRIAQGEINELELGNLEISRDWGWAPDYVDAMWRMLQLDTPDDFVIATGKSHTLNDFLSQVFECFGLDWRDYVIVNHDLTRPLDIEFSKGNPAKAAAMLDWSPRISFEEMVRRMVEAVKVSAFQ